MPIPSRYVDQNLPFARGGMSSARVYRDTNLDRDVVIKSLLPGSDPRRLLDEIACLQSIRSKHVVQIYDVIYNDDGEISGIVEELVSGDQFAAAAPPNTALEFLKLIYPLAKGLADIHAAGRIHRDIKPTNIKTDGEGCLKIFDFGLGRDEIANASTIGEVGTIGYMAPELFYDVAGGRVYFTTAVDVYAFGVTALYGLTHRVPGGLRRRPPQLPCAEADFSALSLTIPSDIADILNNCLQSVPSARPSMSDIVSLLERHLLRDEHRALLTNGARKAVLDKNNKKVSLSVSGRGSVDISYDGLDFKVTNLSGIVYINNIGASIGYIIPGSCVIALGNPGERNGRTFITMDVSHPEVTI